MDEKIDNIINCPRCSNFFIVYKMRKIKHPSGITLDVCDNCSGMWVDGDEIGLLYSKQEIKKIRADERRIREGVKIGKKASRGGKNGKKRRGKQGKK